MYYHTEERIRWLRSLSDSEFEYLWSVFEAETENAIAEMKSPVSAMRMGATRAEVVHEFNVSHSRLGKSIKRFEAEVHSASKRWQWGTTAHRPVLAYTLRNLIADLFVVPARRRSGDEVARLLSVVPGDADR